MGVGREGESCGGGIGVDAGRGDEGWGGVDERGEEGWGVVVDESGGARRAKSVGEVGAGSW